MAKVEIDLQENSLDNSGDGEILGMVDTGSYGSSTDRHLTSQSFLDSGEDEGNYHFRDLSNGTVMYKIVPMDGPQEDSPVNVIDPDSSGQFYVISNPEDVFNTQTNHKKMVRREPIVNKAKKRDDKRRATHNEVERRRRDKINSWITKLAALVPNSGQPADAQSKGGILAKACDYITELTEKQTRLEQSERENETFANEILRLNLEIAELKKENSQLKGQIAENCIIPSGKFKTNKS